LALLTKTKLAIFLFTYEIRPYIFSDLSNWIASKLHFLSSWPLFGTSFFVSPFTALLAKFFSYTAMANELVSMLVDKCNINSIFSALTASWSCSYAFMLPAATAPNSIVKQAGDVDVSFMIKVWFDR
jgi:sodium-dependent dicarboxylate transporter 2/3/5